MGCFFIGFFYKVGAFVNVPDNEKFWLQPCGGKLTNYELVGNEKLVHLPFFLRFIEGYMPENWLTRERLNEMDYYSCECPASVSFSRKLKGSLWDVEMFYNKFKNYRQILWLFIDPKG